MDPDPSQAVALLAAATLCTIIFTAGEASLLALKPAVWLEWQQDRRLLSRLLYALHRHRSLTVTALILGAAAGVYATAVLLYATLSPHFGPGVAPPLAFLLSGALAVVVGRALPLSYASSHPEATLRALGPVLALLAAPLVPLAILLQAFSRSILRPFGLRGADLRGTLTEDQLKELLAETEKQGSLPEIERRMLYGVLGFGERSVAQAMTPRPDMISVGGDEPLREALRLGLEHKHSRLPVYGENDDDIVGVIHLKDLLPYLRSDELDEPVRVASRPAFHIPEMLPARALLRQMQLQRQSIAIAHDEFGGTAGLVTLEDVLEEIVGDIQDEYDLEEEPELARLSDHEWTCDPLVSLHALEDELHEELPEEEYDSLAAFVLDLAGHIPAQGERFDWGSLSFIAERVQGVRLERVRVIKHPPKEDTQGVA